MQAIIHFMDSRRGRGPFAAVVLGMAILAWVCGFQVFEVVIPICVGLYYLVLIIGQRRKNE